MIQSNRKLSIRTDGRGRARDIDKGSDRPMENKKVAEPNTAPVTQLSSRGRKQMPSLKAHQGGLGQETLEVLPSDDGIAHTRLKYT